MPPEVDIFRMAYVLVCAYGTGASAEAARRANELLSQSDLRQAMIWLRVKLATEMFSLSQQERSWQSAQFPRKNEENLL